MPLPACSSVRSHSERNFDTDSPSRRAMGVALSGARISGLILARKSPLARASDSAASFARLSASSDFLRSEMSRVSSVSPMTVLISSRTGLMPMCDSRNNNAEGRSREVSGAQSGRAETVSKLGMHKGP